MRAQEFVTQSCSPHSDVPRGSGFAGLIVGGSRDVKGHRVKVSEKAHLLTEGLCTVAVDESALLELLEMLKAADVDDRIRVAAQNV